MAGNGDPFLNGSEAGGSGVRLADLDGRLVVMTPSPTEEEVETRLGSDMARRCDVLVVDGDDELAGETHDVLVFQTGLKAQLAAAVRKGKVLVGVVGHGEARDGKSAPWLVLDADEAQVKRARDAYTKVTAGF